MPQCPSNMDLMIEAKDEEQPVFELMRTFKLPGWHVFNNIIPYERADDNEPLPKEAIKKKTKKQIAAEIEEFGEELPKEGEVVKAEVPESEVGMGGLENRVYWPLGKERNEEGRWR
jgi:UV DNA damage endonuclease